MSYKEDIEMQENYEKYGEDLNSQDGNYQKYVSELIEIFGEDKINGMFLPKLHKMLKIMARNEYSESIITERANIARTYAQVIAQKLDVPKISTLDQKEQKLDEVERKTKFINVMNSIIDFVNLIHDRSNPVGLDKENNVMVENGVAVTSPKVFHDREGIRYYLDDENYLSIAAFEKKNQVSLKCGNIAIMVSPDLIDIQFDEKEGIIISKDSEDCKYYKLPENKEKLLETRNYHLNPEWYTDDLTDSVISYNNVSQILLSCITSIEDEIKRENVLQDFNYLLAKARLTTITHIPDKRDQKIEKINEIKESFTKYHDKKEAEIAQLMQENNDLKRKSDDLEVDKMKKEIATLRSQNAELAQENSSLRETIDTERSAWTGIPLIGKLISKRIEARKKKALPQGDDAPINLPDTLQDVKVQGIDYSQAEVKPEAQKDDKDREPKVK